MCHVQPAHEHIAFMFFKNRLLSSLQYIRIIEIMIRIATFYPEIKSQKSGAPSNYYTIMYCN